MDGNARYVILALILVLFTGPAVCLAAEDETPDPLAGRWERVPLPGAPAVVEPGGVVWGKHENELRYWDGQRLRKPTVVGPVEPSPVMRFAGGPDRGAYVVCKGEKPFGGHVFALSDGEARYVTDVYSEDLPGFAGLYVSPSGRLINWGKRFIAVRRGEEWQRLEATLDRRRSAIAEAGDTVHFYSKGRLYSVGPEGRVDARELPELESLRDERLSPMTAVWGEDTLLVAHLNQEGLWAAQLGDSDQQPAVPELPGKLRIRTLFRGRGGAVWVGAFDFGRRGNVLFRVEPNGDVVHAETLPAFSAGQAALMAETGHSAVAEDGSLWMAHRYGPVYRYKDGRLRRYDWHDGLTGSRAYWLAPGRDGRMYVSRRKAVFAFDAHAAPGPLPPGFELWDEYEVAYRQLSYDPTGNIWLFRRDQPGHVSKWDGTEWEHIPVPFDTEEVARAVGDDRGHLVVRARDEHDDLRGYDVAPGGVERFPDFHAALAAAVADGARNFAPDRDMRGCFVLSGGRIWLGTRNDVDYYAEGRWDSFDIRDARMAAWQSARYGVLVAEKANTWYTYDTGQIVPAEFPGETANRYLLGRNGRQPFERDLLRAYPDRYIAVQSKGPRDSCILVATDGGRLEPADPLPAHTDAALPLDGQGFWLGMMNSIGTRRVMGGSVIECDFAASPVEDLSFRRAAVDRAGNLWLDCTGSAGSHSIFVKRTDAFHLAVDDIPPEVGRTIEVDFRASEPGVKPDDFHLFWRFRGGAWQEATADEPVLVRFTESGRYELEFLAMDPHGATSGRPVRHVVRAEVALPDTILVEGEPLRVRDIFWRPPVRAVPSADGQEPVLFWRMEGGEWQRLSQGGVSFAGQEPGEYALEFVAREEGVYGDPTPLRVSVEYAPDYEFIVESRLDQLTSHEHKRRQRAIDAIKAAGPEVIPILKEKLEAAREAARRAGILQTLVRELEPHPEAATAPTPSSHLDFKSAVPPRRGEQRE
ncbi:MAG: hypothetical protein R6X33_15415 [Candidatus Brocadiia bacterium]